jgi:hypothetical protein
MRFTSRKNLVSRHSTFVLTIESISPWPALHGPLVVEYQRGSKRKGHTDPCEPASVGTGVTTYDFGGARFEIPATLYAKKDACGIDGELESKLLHLYVCQVDEKGKPGNMVGGVVLDLARLVCLPEVPARQEYMVECSQSIVEMAGGRPKLVMKLSQKLSHAGPFDGKGREIKGGRASGGGRREG